MSYIHIFKAVGPKLGNVCIVDIRYTSGSPKSVRELACEYVARFPLESDEPLRTVRYEDSDTRTMLVSLTAVKWVYRGASQDLRKVLAKVLVNEGIPIAEMPL